MWDQAIVSQLTNILQTGQLVFEQNYSTKFKLQQFELEFMGTFNTSLFVIEYLWIFQDFFAGAN